MSRLRRLPRRVTRRDVAAFVTAVRGADRASALRALVDGARVAMVLRHRGLRPLVTAPPPAVRSDRSAARRVSGAVDAGLALLPLVPTCLRRSVTLLRELNRRGMHATLHLGVRNGPSGVQAHAWVQVGGDVINDDPELVSTYAPLASGEAERFLARFS